MSGWRTESSVAQCLTCSGPLADANTSRRSAARIAVQHKRENPTHDVVIDREQTRVIEIPASSNQGEGR